MAARPGRATRENTEHAVLECPLYEELREPLDRAMRERLLASESTPQGDMLALQPVHRSRWTACRRGSAAPPTMVLEENVRVSGVSLPAQRGGKPGSEAIFVR